MLSQHPVCVALLQHINIHCSTFILLCHSFTYARFPSSFLEELSLLVHLIQKYVHLGARGSESKSTLHLFEIKMTPKSEESNVKYSFHLSADVGQQV